MTTIQAALLPAVALTACSSSGHVGDGGGAAASCVAPLVVLSTDQVAAGDPLTVTGEWWTDGCNDTGQSAGVQAGAIDVPVVFVQSGREVELTTVDGTGQRFEVRADVTVPADAVPGQAAIAVGEMPPVAFTVSR